MQKVHLGSRLCTLGRRTSDPLLAMTENWALKTSHHINYAKIGNQHHQVPPNLLPLILCLQQPLKPSWPQKYWKNSRTHTTMESDQKADLLRALMVLCVRGTCTRCAHTGGVDIQKSCHILMWEGAYHSALVAVIICPIHILFCKEPIISLIVVILVVPYACGLYKMPCLNCLGHLTGCI